MRFPIKVTENFFLEPIMNMFGASTEKSYVEIGDGTFEVCMGKWFHETFPLAEVKSLAPSDWPWWGGLGVKLCPHHGVGVVGANEGIVNVQLKTPQPAHVLLAVQCQQLWMSMQDADAFLKAMSAATKVPISPMIPFRLADPEKTAG
jgi:hypothetical protein